VVKRKRNKIHGRHISPRVWCTDPDILCTEAIILQGAFGYQESFGDPVVGMTTILLMRRKLR
jgi:hypothetical protein